MPIYGDDQCERCGAVRVARSTLCVNCLVKNRDFLEKEVFIKRMVIEAKKKRITCLRKLLKEAIVHGLKQNQENVKLKVRCERMGNIALRRGTYEKDRKSKDTEKGEK